MGRPGLLLIATGIDRRGAESHVLALGRGMAARGWEVAVAYWGGSGELAGAFRAGGVAVHRLDFGPSERDPRGLISLVGLIRARRPDVVHTHLPAAEFYGNLAAALARVPVVVSTKHSDHAVFRRPAVRVGHILMSAPNRAVVAVSRHIARFVRGVGLWPGTPLVTIHNGIDLAAVDRAADPAGVAPARAELLGSGHWLIGAAGRLEREKGFDELIATMPRILAAQPGARLVIAGEGSRRSELEALIDRLGLGEAVRLLGARRDILTLMHAFDLFVLPSRAEPFGLVLLEAMGARKAVVASAVGGVPEVVLAGETGELVPSGDRAAFAEAVMRLLADPGRAGALGEAGRARVERDFPIERMLGDTERLYRAFLQSRVPGLRWQVSGEAPEPQLLTPDTGPPRPDTRVPIVFMGLMGMDSHNREEEQLVLRLVGRGHPLLYLAPLGVRNPRPRDVLSGLGRLWRAGRLPRTGPGLRSSRLLVLPWRERPMVAALNRRLVRLQLRRAGRGLGRERPVLWLRLPTPELIDQLDRLGVRGIVYDCMDDYSAYPHYRPAEVVRLAHYERRLVARADLIVTLTETVAARFPEAAARVRVLPLGVDLEHFGPPFGPLPPDLARLPSPRLGMVGGLDGRTDPRLLRRLALAEPDWSVVLIGPPAEGFESAALADLPNVYLLGARPYAEVPRYLAGLDVCLIPYRRSPWADAVFPTKLHEYLAVGRPVVATDLPALADYAAVVALASGPDEFVAACRRAARERDPAAEDGRRQIAAAHSLEARCRTIDELLGALVA